jgi:NTP pyrophosphatase (non-canonical NTP hydrolase)
MSYASLEIDIVRWAEARGIVQNSTPMAQAIKTAEEVAELLKATNLGDIKEMRDAYADIMITLIIGAAIADVDLVDCLADSYETIKNRTGKLAANGIFVKDK